MILHFATQFEWITSKKNEICTKPLRQWVLRGRSSIVAHKSPLGKWVSHSLDGLQVTKFENFTKPRKSPPWKMETTQFEWITTNKIRNWHENTEAIRFLRSLFHYHTNHPLDNWAHTICIDYKQSCEAMYFMRSLFHSHITPFEKEDHTVWKDYKQKNSKIAQNQRGNWFNEIGHYSAIGTPHPKVY